MDKVLKTENEKNSQNRVGLREHLKIWEEVKDRSKQTFQAEKKAESQKKKKRQLIFHVEKM